MILSPQQVSQFSRPSLGSYQTIIWVFFVTLNERLIRGTKLKQIWMNESKSILYSLRSVLRNTQDGPAFDMRHRLSYNIAFSKTRVSFTFITRLRMPQNPHMMCALKGLVLVRPKALMNLYKTQKHLTGASAGST